MKTSAQITKQITAIKTAGAKLDAAIHSTAVDVLTHYMEHKDTGLVNRLFLALPKGSRGLALADWLLKFVAVKVNTNKETKADQPFVHDAERVPMMTAEHLAKATATHWYDLKKDKAIDEVFDVQKAFKAMLRHIERSTKVEHMPDQATLKAMAKAVGIPESDVPTKPGLKAKAADAEKAVGAAAI